MKKMDEAWGNKGLQVITAYTQFHKLETIQKAIDDIGLTYPVALDGFFASRFTAPLLCQVWVMGPDGKVAWTGIQGWEEAAMKELLKLKCAGLEIEKLKSEVKPAAKAFGTEKFAEAYRLADEVSYGDYADDVIEQADLIIDTIEDQIDTLNNRAIVHKINGRYDKALACLEELRKYSGLDDVPDVDAEIKGLKSQKDYEAEAKARLAYIDLRIKAWQGFEGIEETEEATIKAAANARDLLNGFAKENKGTTVAKDAEAFAAGYDAWVNELKAKEKPEADE